LFNKQWLKDRLKPLFKILFMTLITYAIGSEFSHLYFSSFHYLIFLILNYRWIIFFINEYLFKGIHLTPFRVFLSKFMAIYGIGYGFLFPFHPVYFYQHFFNYTCNVNSIFTLVKTIFLSFSYNNIDIWILLLHSHTIQTLTGTS